MTCLQYWKRYLLIGYIIIAWASNSETEMVCEMLHCALKSKLKASPSNLIGLTFISRNLSSIGKYLSRLPLKTDLRGSFGALIWLMRLGSRPSIVYWNEIEGWALLSKKDFCRGWKTLFIYDSNSYSLFKTWSEAVKIALKHTVA